MSFQTAAAFLMFVGASSIPLNMNLIQVSDSCCGATFFDAATSAVISRASAVSNFNALSVRILCIFITMFFFSFFAKAESLPVGAAAPMVAAVNQQGDRVVFADIYAQGLTLIYFYPKADTPGCTAEACSLRDSFENLKAKGLQIIGVSRDDVAAQKNFHSKYNLPFTLIADTDRVVSKAFGVPLVMGIYAARQSFLVKDGRIVWKSVKAETRGSAQEIQKAIDSLN